MRRARRRHDPGLRGPGRAPPDSRREPDRPRLVRVGEGAAHRDRLQPPRRPAGLEGDRALEDGALRVHEAGRHVLRAGHHRRQGAGAHRALRRPRRDRRRGARSTSSSSGRRRRRSARPTSPRPSGRSAPPPPPTPWWSRTPCGCRAGGRRSPPACEACSGSRFHLETAETDQHSGTTGGAARNPVAELAQVAAEIFDARTGRVRIPGFYEDVEKLRRSRSTTSRRRASASRAS